MKWEVLRAVVTGAAGDLGSRLIRDLGERGVRIAAWDVNRPALDTLVKESSKLGHEVHPFEVDVSNEPAVREAAKASREKLGGIELWFNYAGFTKIGDFSAVTPEQIDRAIDVNLKGVIWGTRAALEVMEPQGRGRIVNMASVAGHIGCPYLTSYSTTKHAIVGFTRALRSELELRSSCVKLTLVSPGFVDSQMIALGQQFGFPEWLKWALSTPDAVSREVISGIEKNKQEIYPTLNGRIMLRIHKSFPGAVTSTSRLLLARSFKDFLLNRYPSVPVDPVRPRV